MLRTLPSRNRRSDRSNSSRDACRETLPSIGATNLGGAQVPASSPRIRFAPRCESLARSPSQKVACHRPIPKPLSGANIGSYCELLVDRRGFGHVVGNVATILSSQGFDVIASGPEAFVAHLKTELAKWAAVVKAASLKPQ